jgi:hypothetical protein
LIAANLKEDYSDEQIDGFYKDFTDNIAKYEENNALGVNGLFGFTDFNKFKESILLFKKDEAATFQSNEDDKAGIVDISNQDESYYWKLREEDPKDPSTGWVMKKKWPEKDGV